MSVAYYMKFARGDHGAPDRIGGVPTHLPPAFPVCQDSGLAMAFLLQIYCPPLSLPDVLCLQLYQAQDVGNGGNPLPVAVAIPSRSPLNTDSKGTAQRRIGTHDITWKEQIDPDCEPTFPEDLPLYESKVGGLCLHSRVFKGIGEQFLLQIKEEPADFNFAGCTCIVSRLESGALATYLA